MSAAVQACRFGDRCSLHTIEDVIECVGSHSEKTRSEIAEAVAMLTGKSAAYMRSCLSANDGTHNLQFSMLPALFKASGNVAPLRFLAQACGFGIHRIPTSANRQELLLALTDVFDALGPLAHAVKSTPIAQPITPGAAAQITVRAQQVITEMVEVIAAVNFAVEPRR